MSASAEPPNPPPPTILSAAVVDASVWISRLLTTDVNHAQSHAWLRAHLNARATLVAPTLLIVEIAGAIARQRRGARLGERAAHGIMQLSRLRLVTLDPALTVHALRLAAGLRLKGAGAVYVAVARQLGIPLVSWDNEHQQRAGALPPTYPVER